MKQIHCAFTIIDHKARVVIKAADGRVLKQHDFLLERNSTLGEWRALKHALSFVVDNVVGEKGQVLHLYSDLDVLRKIEPPLLDQSLSRNEPDGDEILQESIQCKRLLLSFWPGLWKTYKRTREQAEAW